MNSLHYQPFVDPLAGCLSVLTHMAFAYLYLVICIPLPKQQRLAFYTIYPYPIPVQRPPQQPVGYHAVMVGPPNLLHPNHPKNSGGPAVIRIHDT